MLTNIYVIYVINNSFLMTMHTKLSGTYKEKYVFAYKVHANKKYIHFNHDQSRFICSNKKYIVIFYVKFVSYLLKTRIS